MILKYLEGKKTYCISFVFALYNFLVGINAVSHKWQLAINGVVGGAFGLAVRAAITKSLLTPPTTPTV